VPVENAVFSARKVHFNAQGGRLVEPGLQVWRQCFLEFAMFPAFNVHVSAQNGRLVGPGATGADFKVLLST
jgi:hypothetical protein